MNTELIREILHELRIDENCLQIMAEGSSPNISGAIDAHEGYSHPRPVVQLSKELATKIVESKIKIDLD